MLSLSSLPTKHSRDQLPDMKINSGGFSTDDEIESIVHNIPSIQLPVPTRTNVNKSPDRSYSVPPKHNQKFRALQAKER